MAELDATRQELDQQEQDLEAQRAEQDTLLTEMLAAYEEMNADYMQNMADEAALSEEIAKSESAYYAALSKEEAERIAALNRQNNNKGSSSNSSGATNTGGWLYPLPYQCQVTDSYGYRIHPLTKKYSWHNGVDFGAAAGTAILAAKSGTVTTAAYSGAWGYYVVINHGDGYSTLYAHQPSLSVSVGDYVTQGQTIGYVGSTGYSTGPHLHFTIYYNGSDVNPFNYIGGPDPNPSPTACPQAVGKLLSAVISRRIRTTPQISPVSRFPAKIQTQQAANSIPPYQAARSQNP